MENLKKKRLLDMTYYALVTVSFLMAVIFMIYLATQPIIMYAKVIYWIITDLLMALIIFDIVCTNIKKYKFTAGVILYVLTLVTLAITIVAYVSLSTNLILTATQLFPYLALLVLSWVVNIFTIILYSVGVKLVELTRSKRVTKK